MYNEIVMDHFKNPRNQGSIPDADGIGEVGNPICGDMMKLYLKIGKNEKGEEYIQDIKFETLGCGAAIASTSMLTEMVKGKTLKDALKISREDVASALGGLPPVKVHCSVLATEALKKAVENYRQKNKS